MDCAKRARGSSSTEFAYKQSSLWRKTMLNNRGNVFLPLFPLNIVLTTGTFTLRRDPQINISINPSMFYISASEYLRYTSEQFSAATQVD